MTIQEFKVWFEGFSEGAANPTPEQIALVKKKLSEVTDGSVPLPSKWTSTNTWENLDKGNKTLLHD
jgi:hypothetical protein